MAHDQYNIVDLIQKKKAGREFTGEEIERLVSGIKAPEHADRIPDYQLSALMMAICFQGMTDRETRDLTMCMAGSGEMLDLSSIGGICVDKHSTGGVADTTTLILAPLVAACGAKVAKMSGRGLGHTGGTVDKLESIPGMRTELTREEFIGQVRRIGCAVIGQSGELAPADKVLYGLRDVTATVDSTPLIVSSIMSKKIAAGSRAIVLDVKTGNGALMHTLEKSIELARAMVRVGELAGLSMAAMVTGMDQPLGTHIGNALEVKEAIDILAGRSGGRLLDVSLTLGAKMLVAAGCAASEAEARTQLEEALGSGQGLSKLAEMIEAQGGDPRVCDNVDLLPRAAHIAPIPAECGGFVAEMDTMALGEISQRLGAGRMQIGDDIDPAVGLVMRVELGDEVHAGDALAFVHASRASDIEPTVKAVRRAIAIAPERRAVPASIISSVSADEVVDLR